MSLAKVQTRKARKDQGKCERCGIPLLSGMEYRWFKVGFRSKYKHVRCLKPSCTPKPSELESSNLATVYAAQEDALDNLNDAEVGEHDPAILDQILSTFAEAVQEVADQYREADDNFGGNGATQSAERADVLESSASDLDGFQSQEHELTEDDASGDDPEAKDHKTGDEECNWADLVQEARDAVEGIELP